MSVEILCLLFRRKSLPFFAPESTSLLRIKRGGAELRPFCREAQIKHRGYSLRLQRVLTDFGSEVSFGRAVSRVREPYAVEVPVDAVRQHALRHGKARAQGSAVATIAGMVYDAHLRMSFREAVGNALINHPKVAMISLTGDIATGKKVLTAAAKPAVEELGQGAREEELGDAFVHGCEFGAREACAKVKAMDFSPSGVRFDAAFERDGG